MTFLPRASLARLWLVLAFSAFTVSFTLVPSTYAQRNMENLGRGVVAVRSSNTAVLVTWRLLGLDPAGIGFNIYRGSTKLNGSVLTGGTNFTDTSANLSAANSYTVRPVIGGVEQAASGAFTLAANAAVEPIVRVPLVAAPADYYTKFIWVGDLDGDTEYDYVIDRLAPFDPANNDIGLGNQFLEGYRRNGQRLWRIDMGPNSRNTYNIEPGSSTISMGMYDGATVYDLNNDGRAEVILKISNGVRFPNGTTFTNSNNLLQFLAVIDGLTGNMITNIAFPTDYLSDGSLGTQLGIGYPDGINPSVYLWGRNRVGSGGFNDVFACYQWNGTNLTQRWKRLVPSGTPGVAASHQMRIADVDGNGTDEMTTGNMCVNADGTMRYTLAGIGHGDRFYVAKLDPNRAGLQGYGIQQNPGPPYTLEYYYDANTGSVLWRHNGQAGDDVGRGIVGDIDASALGYEVWSFHGLHNGRSNQLLSQSLYPYPVHTFWWDGDLLSENLNDSKFEKWNPANPTPTNGTPRLLLVSNFGAVISNHNPMFLGDIMGDWRSEVICLNSAHTQLMIFTTNIPSTTRLYTMPHNPAYRTHMTVKGYLQSPLVDYYLGAGMSTPPVPRIRYASGTTPTPNPDPNPNPNPGPTIADGTYRLQNRATGLVLDNMGSTADGTSVGQWALGTSNNQRWVVTTVGGFRKLSCVTGGKFLDSLGNTADGSVIGQWANSSSVNQQWTISQTSAGFYRVINRANGKALDTGGQTTNGTFMQNWPVFGSRNQEWTFIAP